MITTPIAQRRVAPPQSAQRAEAGPGRQLWQALLSARARVLRFVLVGGLCGLVQLALFVSLEALGVGALVANVLAYLLSAQLNFVLSDRFIWGDRGPTRAAGEGVAGRWAGFHVSIAGTFLLNQLIFLVGRLYLPDVLAAAAGIGLSALVNFVIQDRLTFRWR